MASAYAPPAHNRSFSGTHLSPARSAPRSFANSGSGNINADSNAIGAAPVRKATSNGNLYTHAEVSRESSPLASPYALDQTPAFDTAFAQHANGKLAQHRPEEHRHHTHARSQTLDPSRPPHHPSGHSPTQTHTHNHSEPHSHSHSPSPSAIALPMKARPSRPRGESDLGRPAGSLHPHAQRASTSCFSLPEALTSFLIPLPYILASAAYSSASGFVEDGLPPLSAYARLQQSVLEEASQEATHHIVRSGSGLVEACTLTSATLLLVGVIAKMRTSGRMLDRRKVKMNISQQLGDLVSASAIKNMTLRALGVGLPFYASTQIGGLRTGLILLVAFASSLTDPAVAFGLDWQHILTSRKASIAVIALSLVLDLTGTTFTAPVTDLALGYLAVACTVLLIPPPLPTLAVSSSASREASSSSSAPRSSWSQLAPASPLTCSVGDVNLTLAAGVGMCLLTMFMSIIMSTAPPTSAAALAFSMLSLVSSTAAVFYSQPYTLNSPRKAGLGIGCFVIAACAFLFSPSIWPGTICNGGISALSFLGVLYDTSPAAAHKHHDDHDHHDHHAHGAHDHHHEHTDGKRSFLTKYILNHCEPGSLVHGIVSEKDSRRIAYFTVLNFAFMIVQGIYAWLSGSLGLLSDTVHMLFDCLGLVVGLGAAVASKWPLSPEKPYGWGKLNTLAGFGNGIFLMLVSVEFVWEAVEGIVEQQPLRHVQELLVVSILGFLVNMVGLFAFGHAHAGHDHGGHGHSHAAHHDHGPADSHAPPHDTEHDPNKPAHANGDIHGHGHGHDHLPAAHPHAHHNENMHGIYLHVAADAGGSLAVIFSTALTLWKPWYGWDPLATIIIAILIFAAAVPLVTASGLKLLLVIPDELEYSIRNALQDLGEMRGVVGYAVPRFWVEDKGDDVSGGEGHGHDHGGEEVEGGTKEVLGVVHVIAGRKADVEDVRRRVCEFIAERRMALAVHVEREGEGRCWCGGGHRLG